MFDAQNQWPDEHPFKPSQAELLPQLVGYIGVQPVAVYATSTPPLTLTCVPDGPELVYPTHLDMLRPDTRLFWYTPGESLQAGQPNWVWGAVSSLHKYIPEGRDLLVASNDDGKVVWVFWARFMFREGHPVHGLYRAKIAGVHA